MQARPPCGLGIELFGQSSPRHPDPRAAGIVDRWPLRPPIDTALEQDLPFQLSHPTQSFEELTLVIRGCETGNEFVDQHDSSLQGNLPDLRFLIHRSGEKDEGERVQAGERRPVAGR
jgi:hypothetical protein